jgi:hypothetical protein
MRINIEEQKEREEESGSDQESHSSPENENEHSRQDSQHPLREEEEDMFKQHIPVKAVGSRKGNMRGRNQAIESIINQYSSPSRVNGSDYKTYSTLTDIAKFPKERFKKFVSTTYNDWFYDR